MNGIQVAIAFTLVVCAGGALLTIAYRGRQARIATQEAAETAEHVAYWAHVHDSVALEGLERHRDEVVFTNLRRAYDQGVYPGLGTR